MMRSLLLGTLVCCLALLGACGGSVEPPPIPTATTAATATVPAATVTQVPPTAVPGQEPVILENDYALWISEEEPAAEVAISETMQSWVGEKVIFLPPAIEGLALAQYASNAGNNGCSAGWNKEPYDPYAGKTGVIVSAVANEEPEVRIALDGTDQEVVLCSTNGLGFLAELEFAAGLVGQELWTRKALTLARTCPSPVEVTDTFSATSFRLDKYEVAIPPISKVVVTRVEWGIAVPGESSRRREPAIGERPIRLYFETADGQEYCTYSSKQYFVDRFHSLAKKTNYSGLEKYTGDFYLHDPATMYPDWSPDVWDLVRKGEIAVGMDLEMALFAAGGRAWIKGYALADGRAGMILQASAAPHQKFVVHDGQVSELLGP